MINKILFVLLNGPSIPLEHYMNGYNDMPKNAYRPARGEGGALQCRVCPWLWCKNPTPAVFILVTRCKGANKFLKISTNLFSQAGMSQHQGLTGTEYNLLLFKQISSSCMHRNHMITECSVLVAILSYNSLVGHHMFPPYPPTPTSSPQLSQQSSLCELGNRNSHYH